MNLRRTAAALAALTLITSGIAAPTPAHAASIGDLRIKHATTSDRSQLRVCKDWSGSTADLGCKNGTTYIYLSRGAVSPPPDYDGFYSPLGCGVLINGTIHPGGRWHKVSGWWGATRTATVVCR